MITMAQNENGNLAARRFVGDVERAGDYEARLSNKGYQRYVTDQDAEYFGVWVNLGDRVIITYCEGDETTITCPTPVSFAAELKQMAEFYGERPPGYDAPRPGDDLIAGETPATAITCEWATRPPGDVATTYTVVCRDSSDNSEGLWCDVVHVEKRPDGSDDMDQIKAVAREACAIAWGYFEEEEVENGVDYENVECIIVIEGDVPVIFT